MSTDDTSPTPEKSVAETGSNADANDGALTTKDETPPWGDDFTPDTVTRAFNDLAAAKGFDRQARLEELEKAAKQAEDSKLTEVQRIERERDEARVQGNEFKAELARMRAAITHGFDEKQLALLADIPADKVEDFASRLAEHLKGERNSAEDTVFSRHPKEKFTSSGGNNFGSTDDLDDVSAIGERMFRR